MCRTTEKYVRKRKQAYEKEEEDEKKSKMRRIDQKALMVTEVARNYFRV